MAEEIRHDSAMLSGLFASAVCGPLDGLVRPVTAALALAAVIGLLAGSGRLVSSSSTVAESARPQPSADVGAQGLDRDRTRSTNDDGYLKGLLSAMDDDS